MSTLPHTIGPVSINNTPEQDIRLNFDHAYWLSLPKELRVFQGMRIQNPDGTTASDRGQLAIELTKQGFKVDFPIMVWDFDPYYTMVIRENEGAMPTYTDGTAIKVSSNINDYPPFDPVPPPIPISTKLVGYNAYANVFYSTEAGKAYPDYSVDPAKGKIQEGGYIYHKSVVIGIMGPSAPTHLWYRQ